MAGHLAVSDFATRKAYFWSATAAFNFVAMLALPNLYS
jgi:hypothetical protein